MAAEVGVPHPSKTRRKESLKMRLRRMGYNFWPCIFGTGGRVSYMAENWRELEVTSPLSWRTRNYVGTIFGGSIYSATDPFFMLMLIHNLGPKYTVWDKAATVRFRKPGRTTLYARFVLPDTEIESISAALIDARSIDRIYKVDLTDANGVVHATVEKTIYFRRKDTDAKK